jgi:hypothetical protein
VQLSVPDGQTRARTHTHTLGDRMSFEHIRVWLLALTTTYFASLSAWLSYIDFFFCVYLAMMSWIKVMRAWCFSPASVFIAFFLWRYDYFPSVPTNLNFDVVGTETSDVTALSGIYYFACLTMIYLQLSLVFQLACCKVVSTLHLHVLFTIQRSACVH